MGKPTGFMEYQRETGETEDPKERIKHYREFHRPLKEEKQRLQAARCMECGVPFCQSGVELGGMVSGCPLYNLIPEWNDLIYQGNIREAYDRLKKTNNFPEFTARVCPAPCEAACTCGLNGTPVSIKENERYLIEQAYEKGFAEARPVKVRTDKKIAIIGSGPAGLAAADQLNKRGHQVTVYEREDKPGGLLMYGIPNMKLEKHVVERKIEIMKQEGVGFLTQEEVATKQKAERLLKEYDRIILACGASCPREISVPGREAEGIYFAVDFLKAATKSLFQSDFGNKQDIRAKGKRVVVIGGGDTGNDCVATAIRQGAASVVQLEMLPKPPEEREESNPWPEWPKIRKTDYGQEEAVFLYGRDPRIYQTTVKEFLKDQDGRLCGVQTIRLEAKRDSETGKSMLSEIPGSEKQINADLVLIAAGFTGAEQPVAKAFGVELNEKNQVIVRDNGYQTSRSRVFTAGDMKRGQSLVVYAIREGREAARAVDLDLMGDTGLAF